MGNRTPAYWPTRIMLAVGIVSAAAVILADVVLARRLTEPCFGCAYPDVLGLPANVVGAAIGAALAAFGLVWMFRIFRGPRDKPPVWRYRR